MNESEQNSPFGLNIKHIIWTTRRRKGLIVLSALLGLALAELFIMFVPPKYVATAQLLFNTSVEQLVSSEQELRTSYGVHQIFESAAAMLQSPRILKPVALKIISQPGYVFSESSSNVSAEERLIGSIDKLQKGLTIKTPAADQVIVLEYKSKSPGEAAYIANLIAATFLEQREASRKTALAQATEWLDQRSAETKKRLIAIDKKIQEFEAHHRIESETGSTALEAELTRKREQLSAVETRRAESQTLYETLQRSVTGDPGNYESLPDSVGGSALERLRSSLAEAQGSLASSKAKLGAYHPDIQAKEGQLSSIRAEIAVEVRRRQMSSRVELEQLTSRERSLREEIKSFEKKVYDSRALEVQLQELQRDRDATKTLYDSMLSKLMQMNLQQTLNFAQFSILLDATVPKRPKLPPALILSAGAIAGLGFGIFVSVLWELLRGRLVTFDQARRQLRAKLITQVPLITRKDFDGVLVAGESAYQSFARKFPASLFANRLLGAQLAIDAIESTEKCKIVMITSPRQGNGKTHVSSNLASLSVLLGMKTLFIDFDVRNINRSCDRDDTAVSEKLQTFLKDTHLEKIFTAKCGSESGDYDVLQPRVQSADAFLRFFQTKAGELFNFVRLNYDHVWIDTPPAGIFNDSLMISRRADGVMIVAEWPKTTVNELKDTINLIMDSGGDVLGVIINKVEVDRLISESMVRYAEYYNNSKKQIDHYSALQNLHVSQFPRRFRRLSIYLRRYCRLASAGFHLAKLAFNAEGFRVFSRTAEIKPRHE